HRLRAAFALANFAPKDPRWSKWSSQIVDDLISEGPLGAWTWSDGFRHVKEHLQKPLTLIFHNPEQEKVAERALAADLLGDYVADQPGQLADLLMDGDERQFLILFPRVKLQKEAAIPLFKKEAGLNLSDAKEDPVREKLAKRQANAAAALLILGQPESVWG